MKKMAAALTGVITLTAAAGLLLSDRVRAPQVARGEGEAPPPKPARALPSADDTRLAQLMKEGTSSALMEMVSLYSMWSKTPARAEDRRAIVDEILRRTAPSEAIMLLSMAVAGDPTPLQSDTMLGEVARTLAPLWHSDAMFAAGRDMLRLAETDKTRALLAASLTERAARAPAGLPEISKGEQHELASDLIQINMHTADPALKAQTLDNVRTVAGANVAEVLADPANAHNSLAARRAEQASRESAALLGREVAP